MNKKQAQEEISTRVEVTRQMVTVAKTHVLDIAQGTSKGHELIQEGLKRLKEEMPDEVVLHDSVDPLESIKSVAASISWRIAFSEAIWELIHSNHLVQTSLELIAEGIHINWTTVVKGGSGHSGGWNFGEYVLPVPRTISRPPSTASEPNSYLSNGDLYLAELDIVGIHPEVEASLREAVLCFRHELYTASCAMLGKATEGAWLDLGASLADWPPDSQASAIASIRERLEDPYLGIAKKIEDVIALYERQDIFQDLSEKSGVSLNDLRHVSTWSHTVRQSRNTIHFGVEAPTPNTYEKIAALLLGAVPNLRVIYRLKNACQD